MNILLKNSTESAEFVVSINNKICQAFYALCIILCVFLSSNAQSHPHSWIDLKTVIEGDQNQITGFNMSWTFDAITSAYMLDGEDLSEENKAKALQEMADGILENLSQVHYFTYFYTDGAPTKYSLATDGNIVQGKTKLTLNYFLPLSKSKLISDEALELLIYESSYYVQMSWRDKADVSLSSGLANSCSLELVEPQPTEEQTRYASDKPADAIPDNKLGSLFSQRVKIACSAQEG